MPYRHFVIVLDARAGLYLRASQHKNIEPRLPICDAVKTNPTTGKTRLNVCLTLLLAATGPFDMRGGGLTPADGATPPAAGSTGRCPLPEGVPPLDEMAGDWKNLADLEQFPSIHNFNGQRGCPAGS